MRMAAIGWLAAVLLLTAAGTPLAAGDVQSAVQIVRTQPLYPDRARWDCVEGYVRVSFSIGTDGTVANIGVLESQPQGVFDEAAIAALSTWRYGPQTAAVERTEKLDFRIQDLEECRARLAAGKNFDCTTLGRAHASLLNGCFGARRRFAASLNGTPVRRELSQLNYASGKLDIDVIELEILDKRIQLDGEGDMVADSSFDCDRMTRNQDGFYELVTVEDPETIVFAHDRNDEVLLPVRWHFEHKGRFLFKKLHLIAEAEYTDVSFEPCESNAGDSQ